MRLSAAGYFPGILDSNLVRAWWCFVDTQSFCTFGASRRNCSGFTRFAYVTGIFAWCRQLKIRGYMFSLGFIFDPKVIISDFESGLIEAVQNQFPGATHSGCHFHFTQAVWRKVQHCLRSCNCIQQYLYSWDIRICSVVYGFGLHTWDRNWSGIRGLYK